MGEIVEFSIVILFMLFVFYFLFMRKYTAVVNTVIIFYMLRGSLYRIVYNILGYKGYDITIFAIEFIILFLFIYSILEGKAKIYYKFNILSLIFIFYMWMFISALFTYPNIIVGIYGVRWVVIPPMFVFFIHNHNKYIKFSNVVNTLFIMCFLNIIYAIIQSIYFPPFDYPSELFNSPLYRAILKGKWIGLDLPIMIGNKIRPYGFLSNIVIFNNTIPMIVLFLMGISNIGKDFGKRIYMLLFFYFIYIVLNFYEKAQILTIGIGTVIISIFMLKIKKNIIMPLIYLIFIIFLFFMGFIYSKNIYGEKEFDPYMKRFLEVFNPVEGTGKYRFITWHKAIDRFMKKPFGWGVGYARSTSVAKRIAVYPHNMYLQFLVEGGIIGFLIFIILYFYMIYYFIYYGVKGNFYSFAFAVVLISIGIYGLGTSFFERLNSFIFWILFYISYHKIKEESYASNTD